jgi:hypothetical protein
MNVYNLGINWLIKGHMSKISLDFQNRPYYKEQGIDIVHAGRKNQVVMQYQIFF